VVDVETSAADRRTEPPFVVTVCDGDGEHGTIRVGVSGEIDLTTSPAFQDQVEALAVPRSTVVLDLAGVSFIDSTGLKALWTIRQRSAVLEGRLLLAAPSESVTRLLQLTKLDKVFDYADAG
jgi:anti-anti-sigma factor